MIWRTEMEKYVDQLIHGTMPIQTKKIKKLGTIEIGLTEGTMLVFKDKLYLFEYVRPSYPENSVGQSHFRLMDLETNEYTTPFAHSHVMGSAFVEGDTIYAFGVKPSNIMTKEHDFVPGNQIYIFRSNDLINWESHLIVEMPEDWQLYNTSMCKGPNGYVLLFESGTPPEIVGCQFTMFYALADDIWGTWTVLDPQKYSFTKERYSGGQEIKYIGEYYYISTVEELPCRRYVNYIARTKDFLEYEIAMRNPVLMYDDNDKKIYREDYFSEQQLDTILNAVNVNNSDLSYCEFEGKTRISYSWGNQLGKEFLALAEYDGSIEEFVNSFFV
jgi:hypothetical protein